MAAPSAQHGRVLRAAVQSLRLCVASASLMLGARRITLPILRTILASLRAGTAIIRSSASHARLVPPPGCACFGRWVAKKTVSGLWPPTAFFCALFVRAGCRSAPRLRLAGVFVGGYACGYHQHKASRKPCVSFYLHGLRPFSLNENRGQSGAKGPRCPSPLGAGPQPTRPCV